MTVESCTGGLISKLITDLEGSSRWFESGIVTYSNQAKMQLVNVPRPLLEKYGAVSEQVASAMAEGGASLFDKVMAVAVTGIAGPDGGSEEKPVGTVCFAVTTGGRTFSYTRKFDGNRHEVREQAAKTAIELLLQHIGG